MIKSLSLKFVLGAKFALAAFLITCAPPHAARAQTPGNLAPGAPGKDAQWPGAGKSGVGTSNSLESKVWFTLGDGVMTEVYYPTVDVANTRTLEFVLVRGVGANRRVELESADTVHRTEVLGAQSLSFRQVSTAKDGTYTITKTYSTDPERHTILVDVQFRSHPAGGPFALYVYYDPSLANSGMHDAAWTQGQDGALLASDADKASALVASTGFAETTNGYFETSDGLTQLRSGGRITNPYVRASDGNVVQLARVSTSAAYMLTAAYAASTRT